MAVDPSLWASVPFRNPTAWSDFTGSHYLWHQALAQAVLQSTGNTYRTYPIGTGQKGDRAWLLAVQSQYQNAARALGLAPPPDLASYDLSDQGDFASYLFILSNEARRLRVAAGLT